MKIILRTIMFLLVVSLAGSAAVLPMCTTLPNLQAVLDASSQGGCFNQDKIFTNWSYTGNTPASSVTVNSLFAGPTAQGIDQHGFVFAVPLGGWTSGFTLSYTISVDPLAEKLYIFEANDQLHEAFPGNSIVDTQVPVGGPTFILNTTSGNNNATHFLAPVKSITTTSVATITGTVNSYEQYWYELTTPEPSVFAFMLGGAGLIAIGRLRRKRQ